MSNVPIIRKASPDDVENIFGLLELYTAQGIVLRRSREDILHYLPNFRVAESAGIVCGCCAVRDFGNGLREIRSLVIHPEFQGCGIGKAILLDVIADIKQKEQPGRLFTLTMQVEFFSRLGFREVAKENFPEKIWSDCSKCPKFDRCDEVAMLFVGDQE